MEKNVWHQVSTHPELYVGQYLVPNFMSNSLALKDSRNDWLFISPGASLIDDWRGRLRGDCDPANISLVMPNAYHFMGVERWLLEFPRARLYASRKAKKRLNKKGLGNILALEDQSPPLPHGYSWKFPPGHRGGDVWLCKDDPSRGNVWITCDSFLNYERLSNRGVARAMQRLLGAAPGLKMSQVIKWLIVDDRDAFKHWALECLAQCPPSLLIPSHGELDAQPELADRLKNLITARL